MNDPTTAATFADAGSPLRVLIVSEHASARYGGEAALPLHYFRVLRNRGVDVWLVTHARTRDELTQAYPGERRIHYVEDTRLHRLMWQIGKRLPAQIAYFTTGFVSRFAAQLTQRSIVKQLVADERIDVIHQPMPVSPREPSMMFGFGVPVIIGPMNGGMEYPPAFQRHRGPVERVMVRLGRLSAAALNHLMPGKRQAALLLVANARTRDALPSGLCPRVIELVENGVDLALWQPRDDAVPQAPPPVATFIYLGRLIDWKAVDLLLEAFADASRQAPMRLLIVGDGVERPRLESMASQLGIAAASDEDREGVWFAGWLTQATCARELLQADCLVLPSLLECGGAVVLEAMSMSKPVIATAWGGPLDYLDEHCGVLVSPRDRASLVEGLANAFVKLAQAPEECRAMGRKGREKVLRDYDWDVKVDRVMALYRRVCSEKPLAT
ncbi:glycosyltransferase family 4 protein [Piscinibacter sp.]|uniref:glycosyltransferase family 4 protein n=1 Tax=Piscinibacter sp. TaxID=1903157 RepID=UPI002CD2A7CA|nr:glycosyltransferase family 4 protein [Albitalea sp.]HUG23781.1 glycosyltransferase family 4 protein [Albitalea sp.]